MYCRVNSVGLSEVLSFESTLSPSIFQRINKLLVSTGTKSAATATSADKKFIFGREKASLSWSSRGTNRRLMALAVTYNGEPSSSQFAPSQWKDNFTQRTCGWYDCCCCGCCERKGRRRRKREEWIMDRHTRSQRERERVRILEGDIERKWESVCKRVQEREKERSEKEKDKERGIRGRELDGGESPKFSSLAPAASSQPDFQIYNNGCFWRSNSILSLSL